MRLFGHSHVKRLQLFFTPTTVVQPYTFTPAKHV